MVIRTINNVDRIDNSSIEYSFTNLTYNTYIYFSKMELFGYA